MINGPFPHWKHTHIFIKLDSHKTIINDEIDFKLPFYLQGRITSNYILRSLKRIFDFRKNQTIAFMMEKRDKNPH
jgi:ligand-binding SRPBCC domain-containing protein